MKKEESLKKVLAILVIILVCLVSIGGIYAKDKNAMKNILPKYVLGMDLDTDTIIKLDVKNNEDNSSDRAEDSTESGQANENVNTLENYKKSKKIIEKRLKTAGVEQYSVRLDENTGSIVIEVPHDTETSILQNAFAVGKTEIKLIDKSTTNSEGKKEIVKDTTKANVESTNNQTNEEVIGDQKSIKKITTAIDDSYNSYGVGSFVKLDIEFSKEAVNKFKELQNNANENKSIKIVVDGSTICSMSEKEFLNSAVNGTLPLKLGDYTKDREALNKTLTQANNIKNIMESESLPVKYTIKYSADIHSNINKYGIIGVFAVLLAVMFIYLVIKHKLAGVLAELTICGLGAFLLLVIRYTKVEISIATIVAIAGMLILQFIYLIKTLNSKKVSAKVFNETIIEFTKMLIPAFILSVVGGVLPALGDSNFLAYGNIVEISNFGMVIFWGLILFELFNNIITRAIFTNAKNK
ncbi:MAG: hypothetical protein K6B70_05700 [Clostridia bacterium]|nr:hypothetical protein [Clostridia bacterium]